jgi:hypothetical protein
MGMDWGYLFSACCKGRALLKILLLERDLKVKRSVFSD